MTDTQRKLKVGDTIKCSSKNDLISMTNELSKVGIETDFFYEKDGESGLWLKIVKVGDGT